MKLVGLSSDGASEFNSSHFRGVIPARAFQKAGHRYTLINVRAWMDATPEVTRAVADADLVIVQRVPIESSRKNMHFWRNLGRAVVLDCDDFYDEIEPHNQAYKFWGKGLVEITAGPGVIYDKPITPHPLQQLRDFIRVSAFTSPGKLMVEYYKEWGPSCYVPNYYDTGRFLNVIPPRRKDDRIIIGYSCSMSHVASFAESGVKEAIGEVARQRPQAHFVLFGDKRLYDMLPTEHKTHQQYVKWDRYAQIVAGFDIMLAPLAKRYDHYRSWIKCAEAALLGTPIIATRSVIYEEFEQAGVGKFVSNGDFDGAPKEQRIQEWTAALLDAIDHLADYKERAKAWPEWGVELLDVDVNLPKMIKTYESVMAL